MAMVPLDLGLPRTSSGNILRIMAVHDFSQEMTAYEAKKEELVKLCEGKFSLFKGAEFAGTFDTSSAAYAEGIARYGNVPFFIKQVLRTEVIEQIPALSLGLMHAHF
jgi:hypothetical protein